MDKTTYTDYDQELFYKETIAPLVLEIKRHCKLNKIPFIISVAMKNKSGETKYCNDGIMPGSNNIKLYDDQFRKYLLVMQGADVSLVNIEEDMAAYIEANMDMDE